MSIKAKLAAAVQRANGDEEKGKGYMKAKVQSVRMENKADRAEKQLGKYVASPKAPQATKNQYNEAKKYLGGEYQSKPLNRMTDVNYSDPKAAKYSYKADKANMKSELSYKRYQSKNQ